MILLSLGIDRQCGLRGNIVNIWNPINNLASVLPRHYTETSTIQLAFMRKMNYTHPYLCETIRPAVVYKAAKYLVSTPLYQNENILLSEEWAHYRESATEEFLVNPEDVHEIRKTINTSCLDNDVGCNSNDTSEFDEECSEDLPTEEVTMLHEEDLNIGIRYAPREGQSPLSLVSDLNAEILSFPTIYCGQLRLVSPECKASYTDIVRSEARRFDRRSCTPVHLLYQYKRLQILNIHSAINISLRKKKLGTSTASNMLCSEYVNNILQHDDGYKFLRGIKSSPAYWEKQQRKVLAMIRQLGIPTFFVTLSAAESRWKELIVILAKVLDNKDITEEDVDSMTLAEKNDYIRRDPVTCARYFDHRFRSLYSHLFASGAVFAEFTILDFYWRIEFQHRGSPHVHMIIWLKDSPIYAEGEAGSAEDCSKFIDRFITCTNDDTLAAYQSHKHSFTCWKKSRHGKVCRFNIPVPPMPHTTILKPHSEKTSQEKIIDKENLEKVKLFLVQIRREQINITFTEFLAQLELNERDYISAVKSSIKRSNVFLKRNRNASFINAYNSRIAEAWRANMDIQFILDPYACAKYVVQYINKSCRGVSKLIREAAEEIRKGNYAMKEQLRKFGNCVTNGTEVSSQEAAYGVLGMQLVLSSRADTFIPTSIPDQRVFLIKSDSDLAKLDADSTDIAVANVLNHYTNRPNELKDTCLAVFSAWYEYLTRKPAQNGTFTTEESTLDQTLPHAFDGVVQPQGPYYTLMNHKGFVRKRSKAKIIRYRNFSEQVDPKNYYREQCMLYLPWRDEDRDLLNINCETRFNYDLAAIKKNKKEFQPSCSIDLETELERMTQASDDDEPQNAAPRIDNEYRSYFDQGTSHETFENQSNTEGSLGRFPISARIADSTYVDLANTLNSKQRQYFTHIMRQIRSNSKNSCEFVGGGAGVGKTHLIKTIVQWVVCYQLTIPGMNPLLPAVLLCAPTGKAAFHIRGMTLHAAFCLPLNQNKLSPLDFSKLNTLRANLQNIRLVIMDEVSMCSSRILQFIDFRLQQIFENKKPFGGKYFLCFGDLHQLRPVGGNYVFKSNSDDVGVIAGAYPWNWFKFFELTEIMRQNNAIFAQALNNLAIGNLSETEVFLFKSREISSNLKPSAGVLRLFNSNSKVDTYNNVYLNTLETETIISEATDIVLGALTESSKNAILKAAHSKSTKDTLGLPRKLLLKVGAKYMMTTNIDTSDGLVNGSTGTLKEIRYAIEENIQTPRKPIMLLLDFQDPEVGKNARNSHNLEGFLTPIVLIVREIHKWPSTNSSVNRRQFPLVPAHALTFWKAQGMTYESVVVNTCSRMDRQQLYVACSRVTTLEGLYVDGVFQPPNRPAHDDPVENELSRLRKCAPIVFNVADIPQTYSVQRRITYQNVQSFLNHRDSVVNNEIYNQSDILLFTEPKIMASDICSLENYICSYRLNSQTDRRSSTGLLVFSKPSVNLVVDKCLQDTVNPGHAELVSLRVGSLIIVLGYKSPRKNVSKFLEMMKAFTAQYNNERIMVIGDFNIDAHENDTNEFLAGLIQDGFMSALPKRISSNDNGTLIDYCVTNDPDIQANFTESNFSYHRPMIVFVRHE